MPRQPGATQTYTLDHGMVSYPHGDGTTGVVKDENGVVLTGVLHLWTTARNDVVLVEERGFHYLIDRGDVAHPVDLDLGVPEEQAAICLLFFDRWMDDAEIAKWLGKTWRRSSPPAELAPSLERLFLRGHIDREDKLNKLRGQGRGWIVGQIARKFGGV